MVHARQPQLRPDRGRPGLSARVSRTLIPWEARRPPPTIRTFTDRPGAWPDAASGIRGGHSSGNSPQTLRRRAYIRKHIDRAVEDVGTNREGPGGEVVFRISNPGFGVRGLLFHQAGARRRCRFRSGARLRRARGDPQQRLSGRWAAHASYTWSRLVGKTTPVSPNPMKTDVWRPISDATSTYPLRSFDEEGAPVEACWQPTVTHQMKVQGFTSGRSAPAWEHVGSARAAFHGPAKRRPRRTSPSCPGDGTATGGCPSSHHSTFTSGTTCASGPGIDSGSAQTS